MTLERVLLAGGGTAGHVLPLLATVQEITDRHTEAVITVVGSPDGIEERLVPERGFTLSYVPKVAFPRRPNVAALRFPAAFRGALRQAEALVAERRPQVVVGFGGYVSTPIYLAARKAGIPIVIHEQNARPGLANKLGVRWAAHTATTFPGTPLAGAEVVGMPLRREIRELRPAMLRAEARPTRCSCAAVAVRWRTCGPSMTSAWCGRWRRARGRWWSGWVTRRTSPWPISRPTCARPRARRQRSWLSNAWAQRCAHSFPKKGAVRFSSPPLFSYIFPLLTKL